MLIERPSKSAQNSQEYGEGGDTDTFNNTSTLHLVGVQGKDCFRLQTSLGVKM